MRRRTEWMANFLVGAAVVLGGCSGGGTSLNNASTTAAVPSAATTGASSAGTSATGTSASVYPAAYKQLSWGSAATVSYSGDCSMTITTTGVPPYHDAYYLAPVSTAYPTAVAETPVSRMQMALVPYTPSSISGAIVTINICPSKAASTTTTNIGTIGYMISGEALYNPYEGGGAQTPALSDNVSYTFTDAAGVSRTASFIDACNSHPTPLDAGYSWHYHGVPDCLTATADATDGASHIIGIALDGFPIYGGRDFAGKIIDVAQLDSCNGITSATPEFPNGAYHYVLPIGVTGKQSSLNCYSGSVSQVQMALAKARACATRVALRRRS